MEFEFSPKTRELMAQVSAFMEEHVYPNEQSSSPKLPPATAGSRPAWSRR